MILVFYYFMVNLSFVFSATISEWNDGNLDMSESFKSVKDIMSYLENNYWEDIKNPYDDSAMSTSRQLADLSSSTLQDNTSFISLHSMPVLDGVRSKCLG